jgi:hypothetical protein
LSAYGDFFEDHFLLRRNCCKAGRRMSDSILGLVNVGQAMAPERGHLGGSEGIMFGDVVEFMIDIFAVRGGLPFLPWSALDIMCREILTPMSSVVSSRAPSRKSPWQRCVRNHRFRNDVEAVASALN